LNLSLIISDLRVAQKQSQTGRRETSTLSRKTNTKPPSEQPQSKTTHSPPASSSTLEQVGGSCFTGFCTTCGASPCSMSDSDTRGKGCALSADNLREITQHRGDSVLLPCSCSHLNTKPQKLTWETGRTGHWTEKTDVERVRLLKDVWTTGPDVDPFCSP
ncbi:polymeric immunoglobulin receptor-like isoform X10, partial [Clarias magur]